MHIPRSHFFERGKTQNIATNPPAHAASVVLAATRPMPSKSSAESMYSVPLLVVFQLAVVGDVAGWSEYAGPSASGIGAPWNAWYFREPPKSALLMPPTI